ncbi:MAG: hypothetical protein ACOH5I_07655 [Oligoflexus sp.]
MNGVLDFDGSVRITIEPSETSPDEASPPSQNLKPETRQKPQLKP